MQNSFDKYIHFSATEFALDDEFINWVLLPDEETDTMWNEFIIANPGQKKTIEGAKKIILSFNTEAGEVPNEIKNRIWESVISKKRNGKLEIMKSRKLWMAAASVMIILIAGLSWFYFNSGRGNINSGHIVKNNTPEHDIAPGGNKATLTLADGSTIVLDSAQNGMLTQQGNAKVVKLQDGKVAYDQLAISNKQLAIQYNTITTPRGGQYQLTLADGSRVWLNAASSITFPTAFTGDTRDVNITGEAYFEVAHDASMPFHVRVNKMDVEVLGTHFNVNAYEDEGEIKTTLLRGSVKVHEGDNAVIISPGEQAVETGRSLDIKKGVNVDEVVAWKNGFFYFNKADVKTVMRQLSRWYDVDVIYKGVIPEREFEGEMQRDLKLSQVLKLLSQNKINFEINGKQLIVKP